MKRRGARRTSLQLRPEDLSLPGLAQPYVFLGRFPDPALREELQAAGLSHAMSRRGYDRVEQRVEELRGEHRLRLLDQDSQALLVDLRLAESAVTALPEPLGQTVDEPLHALVVLWVAMQDPRAAFTAQRPRLPGQDHPGLGLGRLLYEMLRGWGERWGKDALLNVPEYFHNAVFYAAPFRFLEAAEQGRFEALRRDLASLHVAEAAAAIEERRVWDETAGQPFVWEPGYMAAPIAPALQAGLRSEEYRAASAAARDGARFTTRDA